MRARWLIAALLVEIVVVVACGARTGLLIPNQDEAAGIAGSDAGDLPDRQNDVRDAPAEDAPPDVIEEGLPSCDPDALYVYLVTEQTILYRYDPLNNQFLSIGTLFCPTGSTPFSMGVDRKGRAYVVYQSGELFLVDVTDASCEPLDFAIGQEGFVKFGMGFAIDDDMMGETLYVAEISFQAPPIGLGSIDRNTLELSFIGPFSETFGNAMELTSADDGQLYGYMLDGSGFGGHVLRIDKATAEILEETPLDVGSSSSALAFAYWAGDFYVFTSPGGPTTVTRYRPSDGSVVPVATLNETVVGAGVSTCDPHQ